QSSATRGSPESARTARSSTVPSPRGANCLGRVPPRRAERPAATTMPATSTRRDLDLHQLLFLVLREVLDGAGVLVGGLLDLVHGAAGVVAREGGGLLPPPSLLAWPPPAVAGV